MNDVKVSIIIPVYNSEELIKVSLDSAMNQTLREIEIICIDDGSEDGSGDILKEYAKNDSRFKILSQDNARAGQARNNGLNHAKGEYIVFLDSDDWLEKDICELLYDHAMNLDVDLVLFDNRWYLEDSNSNASDLIKKNQLNFLNLLNTERETLFILKILKRIINHLYLIINIFIIKFSAAFLELFGLNFLKLLF